MAPQLRTLFICLAVLFLPVLPSHAQTLNTNKLDDFNRPDDPTLGNPSSTTAFSWNEDETTNNSNIQILNDQAYLVSQGNSGDVVNEYASIDGSNISSYPSANSLSDAGGTVTWAFNMRQTDPNPGGFGNTGTNGIMYVLAGASNDLSGNAWAVIIGDGDATDEIKLVRYNGGFTSNADFQKQIVGSSDFSNQHATVRVTYDPETTTWTLYASAGNSFADPINESNKIGEIQDNTYAGNQLNYTGMVWDHGASTTHNAVFDNVYLTDPEDELPVELVSFDVATDRRQALLSWTTASETNNAGFTVQRRVDGSFVDVGFIEGAGTVSQPQDYRYATAPLEADRHTFRLRQVDVDGTTHLGPTRTVVVEPTRSGLTNTGSNPVASGTPATFTVSTDQAQPVTVTLVNALGQTVRTVYEGRVSPSTELSVQTNALSSGVYFLRAEGRSFRSTKKFTIVR